jgi:hypothetical protein
LISAISANASASRFARSAAAKPRGRSCALARMTISSSGTAAFAAAISSRL